MQLRTFTLLSVLTFMGLVTLPAAQAQIVITTLTLVDAETNEDIRGLGLLEEISTEEVGTSQLSIRADLAGQAQSVRFSFAKEANFQTESVFPYALGGDDNGNYNAVSQLSSPGTYELVATPFSGKNATGQAGSPVTVQFTVEAPTLQIINFTLVDAREDRDIRGLGLLEIINASQESIPTDQLSIRADVTGDVESVRFDFADQTNFRTENTFPYVLGGDNNGDYAPVEELIQPGTYELVVTPFSGRNATGVSGQPITLRITVPESAANARNGAPDYKAIASNQDLIDDQFKMFPNPAKDVFNLTYILNHQAHVRLDLYNTLGQHTSTLTDSFQSPGKHQMSFSVADLNLTNSFYYWKLRIGDRTQDGRLILAD